MNFGDLKPVLGEIIRLLKSIDRNTENSACCTATVAGGSGTSVPAGFRYVSITQTSAGTVVITFPNGSNYTLSTVGQSFTLQAEIFKNLPAFVITDTGGATWEWVGMN